MDPNGTPKGSQQSEVRDAYGARILFPQISTWHWAHLAGRGHIQGRVNEEL